MGSSGADVACVGNSQFDPEPRDLDNANIARKPASDAFL
jgi:hypothetical protein